MTSARYSQAMTVLSRGARVRRGGRRPGWLLLTALLVLAIGASSALVFTNRAELLKLAVILALWAAVVAAFVSVIYRRQSDVDQARVRDLKLVYDLQLDREISARREYELTVESQLRRELASELRAQAADEVAALRAELAALRTNLEILFETELDQRPALETERATVRSYGDWSGTGDGAAGDWVSSNRVRSVRAETNFSRAEETSIIDVPEEPVPRPPVVPAAETARSDGAYRPAEELRDAYRGSHWRPADDDRSVQERPDSRLQRHARRPPEAAPAPSDSRAEYQDLRAQPQHEPQHPPQPEPQQQPVRSDGRAPAAGVQDDWTAHDDDSPVTDPGLNGLAALRQPTPEPPEPFQPPETPPPPTRRGRHSSVADAEAEAARSGNAAEQPPSARHSVVSAGPTDEGPVPAPPPVPIPEPVARHRSVEEVEDREPDAGPPTGGQSVADLLARFQVEPVGGGRRRRREE